MKITRKDIEKQVKGIYYSSEDETCHWEPFEYYEKEDVEEFIDTDVCYWINFLENKGIKIQEG